MGAEQQGEFYHRRLLSLLRALQGCAATRDADLGRLLHSAARLHGLDRNLYISNTLISMYARCGSMPDSRSVFDSLPPPHHLVSWNALLSGYAANRDYDLVLDLFSGLPDGFANGRTFLAAIVACSGLAAGETGRWIDGKLVKLQSLEIGMEIHSRAARDGCCYLDLFVANALVDLYAKCGSLADAKRVFDRCIRDPSVVSWTCLIAACAENSRGDEALELFDRMQREGCVPNARTFLAVLTAWSAMIDELGRDRCLERVREIHRRATELGLDRSETFVANSLIDVYSKLGAMADARAVFDEMYRSDVVSWNSLISGYEDNGESERSLELFDAMNNEAGRSGCEPNARTLVAVLHSCCSVASRIDLKLARSRLLERVAAIESRSGKTSDLFLANTLISAYSKCGSVDRARRVFDEMDRRNVVSWTFLILAYVENGDFASAIDAFDRIDCRADSRCIVAALRACNAKESRLCKLESLRSAMAIHSRAAQSGDDANRYVSSALIDTYGSCGSMIDARRVFDGMDRHDVVSWTALVVGYVDNDEPELALDLSEEMELRGCSPNALTYVSAMAACSALAAKERIFDDQKLAKSSSSALDRGRDLHSRCRSRGYDTEVMVSNSLVEMYSKCRSMIEARTVFDSMILRTVVSWTVLILGYLENGDNDRAWKSYEAMEMERSKLCVLDARVYVAALMVCANLAEEEDGVAVDGSSTKKGMLVHSRAAAEGFAADAFVSNSLVVMYSKSGSLLDARLVFDKMERSSAVSWTALIIGYAANSEPELALEFFRKIQSDQPREIDSRTYIAGIIACGALTALETGRSIHAELRQRELDQEPYLANVLVDFYSRCGAMEEAVAVFDSHRGRNLVTWSSLVAGFARQGEANRVFEIFGKMPRQCWVSSLSVLAACSHGGLVARGMEHLEAMRSRSGAEPWIEHYHCVIDMLGRANRLKEAMEVAEEMPYEATAVTWTILLSASEKWRNVGVGKVAFQKLVSMDQSQPAAYVSNIFKK